MPRADGPLERLIAACAAAPGFTLLVVAIATWLGVLAVQRTPIDALPDLSDVQVIVQTDWEGRSPDLIEAQITWPLSSALLSTPGVDVVRGTSSFGTSWVYVIFDEGTDLYAARSRVLERLTTLAGELPDDAVPKLGPDATGVGWVLQYALVDRTGAHDLSELRTLQDWSLRLALEAVPGVAEVAAVGGFVKAYEVTVDPDRLAARGVALDEVVAAVRGASSEAGGHTLEVAGHELMVRGRAWVDSPDDLAAAPLRASADGPPLRLGDVAEVQLVPAARRGVAELDGQGEVVSGVVIMRHGGDARAVLAAVKERLEELTATLPPGVELITVYDRSELIDASVATLRRTLLEEMVVVALVIAVFLLHLRSAIVPIVTLPVALVLAFVPMSALGVSANIMSLGGIAVALGALVDASVVVIDNVHRRLEAWQERPDDDRPPRADVVREAMQEVGPSIFFSLLVLTVAFLPVFALTGTEGRLFRPLAWTKTWAMAGGAVLAVTLIPALTALTLRGRSPREDDHPLLRPLSRAYEPVVRAVVRWRWAVVIAAVLAVAATVPAWRSLEGEFMPPLDEGTLLYMPTAPPGISATEAAAVLGRMDALIAAVPEVDHVLGKMGRADSATDPAPLGMAETVVTLKPRDQWRPGLTPAALLGELDRKLAVPGMPNLWWMPIQTRTEMLATGVRAPVGVVVLGDDLAELEAIAVRVAEVVGRVPGTRSAFAERATGGTYVDIDVDRVAAARVGLSVAQVHEALAVAVGGMTLGETIAGRARFPLTVRYPRELREDPDALAAVRVDTPLGAPVPLGSVAQIHVSTGPDMIRSEDGRLAAFVYADPGDRPLAAWVAEARAAVDAEVVRPPGAQLVWTGQHRYYERAAERLRTVVPLTLLLIVALVYLNRRSFAQTAIVLAAIPFSLIGAVWLLWWLGWNLSVAVWVGLIALAGLDAETGMVMLLYLDLAADDAERRGVLTDEAALTEAIVEGAARRLRPKLMTVLTTMIGLLPLLWSDGVGADLMKRVAAPMVGGLATSFLLELLVYPALYAMWRAPSLRRAPGYSDAPRGADA
jgi:Cu(I)/Ag(I) efflux system membrane protein CusA/SilA